jgi:formiminotetrahydrofolate cyclodeaminase
METIMFAVGALTMVLLAVASLAIYSTVMVLKLKKESYIDRTEIWRQMHENHQIIYRKFEDTQREIGDVYSTITAVGGKIEDSVEQLQSYTDRRFDKLIDTYLLVKETEKESKQIING